MWNLAMPKHVLITGGAQRLGATMARQFSRNGWSVWCHYQTSENQAESLCRSLREQGGWARAIRADLTDESQRQNMMQTLLDESGPLHCLVNNASSFQPDHAQDLQLGSTRQLLEVNLLAPLELSSLMARSLSIGEHDGQRSVLHVLDQKVFNLNPDYFSYTVGKLALERTVALQAQALAPALRVCGIAPGLMYLSGPQTQSNFDMASRVNLMRRATDPEHVAATCVFLANNPCITGTTITVDNGQHLVPLSRDVMFAVDDMLKGVKP